MLMTVVSLFQTVCFRMAQLLDGAGKLGWVLLKAVLRFVFMFLNNCVAIPSYCLYLLLLQPLRIWDSSAFWHLEGIMFKWLLAMVSSWGWIAGYTGEIPIIDSFTVIVIVSCVNFLAVVLNACSIHKIVCVYFYIINLDV